MAKTLIRLPTTAILALEALHKQVLPFVLRRMKEDVLQDLPPKIIQDYYCDLGKVQQSLYDDFQASKANDEAVKSLVEDIPGKEDENTEMETSPATTEPQKHIFQTLQYLRKLCNHPMLALGADTQRYQDVVRRVSAADKEVSKDPWDISHSPKLLALQ
jgi:TATA-binding protein-associated factor